MSFKLWKVGKNEPLIDIYTKKDKIFHTDTIIAQTFHENKDIVITASLDETYCISNFKKGTLYQKSEKLGKIEAIKIGSNLNALQIGTLEGVIRMIDIEKSLTLTKLDHSSSINQIKFWNDRNFFISSSVEGELIINGSGMYKDYLVHSIIFDDYIHDFDFIDSNQIIIGTEDSLLYVYDIRKGLMKKEKKLEEIVETEND